MQSEPTGVTQKTSSLDLVPDQTDSTHHGHDGTVQPASRRPCAGGAYGSSPQSSYDPAVFADASAVDGELEERTSRQISPGLSSRTGSPVDRIIEHELAFASSPRKRHQGPTFSIIPSQRVSSNQPARLIDFPNEVLTHILSHLPAPSLSEVSLVSHQFHDLVTTPHAWRIAFSRIFPGQETLKTREYATNIINTDVDAIRSEGRLFTRLTSLASWRSEYILRTRLLRSLARGRPAESQSQAVQGSSRSNSSHNGSAQITYNSNLSTMVNHLHANFGTGFNKRLPSFIHGSDEVGSACLSDPRAGKVDNWGFSDAATFSQFVDHYPGESQYGLGTADVIGVPNVMDVSRPYGMIYAEGMPGGSIYYRSSEERRGREISQRAAGVSDPELGIPDLWTLGTGLETTCSVWIAKNIKIPTCSEGLIGILSGSSHGVVTSYSIGTNGLNERRIERGEVTARWVLSPGIPIIAIVADDNVSIERLASNRTWAVALNALGEVYYLTELPTRPCLDRKLKLNEIAIQRIAWETGRTVHWSLVEPSRRAARIDPFGSSEVDGSYTPRTSWNGANLSKDQIIAETREVQVFLEKKPKHFRGVCHGWDMQRRLEVDFANENEFSLGETIVVIGCGLDEGQSVSMRRFTRHKFLADTEDPTTNDNLVIQEMEKTQEPPSIFNSSTPALIGSSSWSFKPVRRASGSSAVSSPGPSLIEEWRTSVLGFGGLNMPHITTTAIDSSTYSLLTTSEDPLLSVGGVSLASSPTSSPLPQMPRPGSALDVPGQRARLIAVGTKTGIIIIWNMRDSISNNNAIESVVQPVRIIYTDSPQISSLALSSLYLVHGGNDGLVQAWDPLASVPGPIRTLNSRFSSRARRRLVQAEASAQGVGINLFAAGALLLDPDPTVLRGIVSLGTHLRYWSYSSSAVDQYKGSKRRTRRAERGSNQASERFSGTGRSALKDYIANEKLELEHEKKQKRKEAERLAGRFGLDLLGPGATEDEILAYATMLSEEAAASDEQRRKSESESSTDGENSDRVTGGAPIPPDFVQDGGDVDADLAEAIRLSLEEGNENQPAEDPYSSGFTVKCAKSKRSPSQSPPLSVPAATVEQDDLDFALQLSREVDNRRPENWKGKQRAS
ncbi:MAG: hypothetical protein Q9214_003322 [Letrouitia sp. 1 TL-2023]